MRFILGLLVVAIAAMVRGQEIDALLPEGPVEEVIPVEEIFEELTETTTAPATTTKSPEELREENFNQDISYLFLIPKLFYVETKERICLLVTKCQTVLEYQVTLLLPNGNEYWSSGGKEAEQGENCFEFEVPAVKSGFSQQLTVRLQLRRNGSENVGDDDYEVTKERFVTVQARGGLKTFVQTDKPIYQPGQTVRFRALTLNSEVKTITDAFDSVVVESPTGQRINQWLNVQTQDGLIDLEHELPDEPQQGSYSIKVTRGSEQVTERFTVEEYVLPRFEVEIRTPPYILITDTTCRVKICGIYTYGKPVQGSVEATITADGWGRYDYQTRTRPEREVLRFSITTTDADGCAVIDVDLTRLELSSTRFYQPSGLSVDATFTETATGEKVTKSEKSSPKVSRSEFSLQFVTDNYFFKPGLPYFGVIDVTNPDGSPRAGENLVVRCTSFNTPVDAISDGQGLAVYTLPVEGLNYTEFNSRDSLSCDVTSRKFPDVIPSNGDTYNIIRPISFLNLSPLYSPSNNYLDVEPVIGQTQAGQEVNLRVHMTTDCPGGPRILAVSRGNIINDFKFKAGLQEKANGIVYDVSFVLTPSMTPLLDLLVYGLLDDGEMLAKSLEIESNAVFENQVHIQVAAGQNAQLTPGAPTSIEITASAGSLCAIGVVDKSVHLLGGDNQIKTTDVVSFLNTFQLSSGDDLNAPCGEDAEFVEPDNNGGLGEPIGLPVPIFNAPVAIARKKRQIGFFPSYRPTPYPLYTDVTKEFEELGLVRISNLNIETSPCKRPEPFLFPSFLRAEANFAFAQADFLSAVGVAAGPVIRSYFPETWLWNIQRSEESPTVYVPDTITEWIGSGFCISSISGFGVSEPFTVNAFKPFFADYNLPYSVIRGEELELQVNIFNYLEKCLPVVVTLARTSEFEIVEGSNKKYSCVCSSSEPTQITFNIRPLSLGDVDLETTVVVVYDNNICGTTPIEKGVTHSDGLRKPILVEPEGEEVENSLSLYFCPSEEDGGIFRHTFDVIVPDEYVEDSGRVIIFLSGDILGNSLTNIDRLLKIPYGCGEQNMIGFVPNIYALQYLQATDQSSQPQLDKALSNMRKGYQKQLNYRRSSGSYSAFGNRDQEGSAWLTAYVVRSFVQASQFIPIDENDLQISIRWLYTTLGQNENGCFRSRGRVIHKEMQGGVNDEVSLTAFILVSLLEAGESKDNPPVANALSCVRNSLASLTDTYSAALIAYALSIADEDPSVAVALEYLESVAINEGGVKYWVSNRPQTTSSSSYRYGATASSLSIEMTAYVLLTYIRVYGTDAVAPGSPISKWLVSQQGPNGGFKSSQDTVVAIHALAEYARLVFGGQANLAVAVGYQEPCTLSSIFVIHDGNRLVLQRADLEHFPKLITAIATGDGCALLQVIIRFNVHPAPPPQPAFTLSYNVGPTTHPDACQRRFKLNICASYTGDDGFSNMAIVEVKLVTGFVPEQSSIALLESGDVYKDITRVEYRQKKVVIYFHQFTAKPYCFDLEVRRVHFVGNPKPGLITVYDYYDPALTLTTEYEMVCQLIRPPVPIPLPIEIQPAEEGPVEVQVEGPIQVLPAENNPV